MSSARDWIIVASTTLVAMLLAGLVLIAVGVKPATAAALPAGFQDELVASTNKPIALAFTPDGRMLIASQSGQLRVYQNGTLLSTPALNIASRICANNDRGLLGVAVDPNFSTNGYVYLFYTHNKSGTCPVETADPAAPVHRVSRFVMTGNTVAPASEQILIDNIPAGIHHNAGDLRFGKDGFLYITTGDGSCDYTGDSGCGGRNDAARDTHILLGKVLRITRNGDIPTGNPYTDPDTSARCNVTGRTDPGKNCRETFASGLRNPFRFAFDPDAAGTRFFIGNVGESRWEQIDEGVKGADYGWNICEGSHDNPGRSGSVDCSSVFTPPIYEYSHDTGCTSVTGSAFVPDSASWPASFNDSYLYGDYVCNKIFELKPTSGGGFTSTEFASGFAPAGPIAMAFGPSGSGEALYYTTFANRGEIHRITYSANANLSPTASVETTSANYGPVPLTVTFDGSASEDPDGNTPLTYLWDFGDGTTQQTGTPTVSHEYTTAGTYTAELKVRDARGAVSSADMVQVFAGDEPPDPTIESPAADKLFRVGEQITLQGSATDPQEGQLSGSALSWEVLQHHNGSHTHPYSSGTGTTLPLTAPPPEALDATGPGNYLEIRFTATDSKGLSKTVTQELQPHRVDVTLESKPTGLSLEADGESSVTPHTLVSWEGYKLNINAPSPQTLAGTAYAFDSWSNGGSQAQDVITGASPTTYTATFKPQTCTISGTAGDDFLDGTAGSDVICGLGGNDTIRGLGGSDILRGGDGKDTLEGGANDDTLQGENNNDKLLGGIGSDDINGGPGLDTASFKSSVTGVQASLGTKTATGEGSDNFVSIEHLEGSTLNDTLTGSTAGGRLAGLGGADKLFGGDGNDTLAGGGGVDELHGALGNDTVLGQPGADMILGEEGDDTLNSQDGVSGNDSLNGGTGTDTCTTDAAERSITGCER